MVKERPARLADGPYEPLVATIALSRRVLDAGRCRSLLGSSQVFFDFSKFEIVSGNRPVLILERHLRHLCAFFGFVQILLRSG
jgi:hypothetical protein